MTGDPEAPGRKILASDAPDFEIHIPKLLKEGDIEDSPVVRYSLGDELTLAWAEEIPQKQPEVELFDQLTNSIKKTQNLLRRLEKFPQWRNVGVEFCPVGEGTISMMAGGAVALPRKPPPLGSLPEWAAPGSSIAAINRQRVLDRLLREIAHKKRTRKQGHQKELHKAIIVARAVSFFRQYSSVEPTGYWDGPCVKFCRHFYEIVTGVTLGPSGLQKLNRKELTEPLINRALRP
jgi:hypothetical protein